MSYTATFGFLGACKRESASFENRADVTKGNNPLRVSERRTPVTDTPAATEEGMPDLQDPNERPGDRDYT